MPAPRVPLHCPRCAARYAFDVADSLPLSCPSCGFVEQRTELGDVGPSGPDKASVSELETVETSSDWSGQISKTPVIAILRRVWRKQLTGTLVLSRGDELRS